MSHSQYTKQVIQEFPGLSYFDAEMIAFERAAEDGNYDDTL